VITVFVMNDPDCGWKSRYACPVCQGQKCEMCGNTGEVVETTSRFIADIDTRTFEQLWEKLGLPDGTNCRGSLHADVLLQYCKDCGIDLPEDLIQAKKLVVGVAHHAHNLRERVCWVPKGSRPR